MKGGITMVIDMHVHPGFYEKSARIRMRLNLEKRLWDGI